MRLLLENEEAWYDWIPYCFIWANETWYFQSPKKKQQVETAVYKSKKYWYWQAHGARRAVICSCVHSGGNPKLGPSNVDKKDHITIQYCSFEFGNPTVILGHDHVLA
ncbi:hypothetical protein PsYK624_153770 [Phanerochaete sordida]|uniref:Uncharacterized protein n=1 Tax=Phanerochaete sordida TaxID=48140 RepID=A0A9P3LL83_9APHY|nr:hypothetical protein PsYK624_153770 [Phanerochaete sordida]